MKVSLPVCQDTRKKYAKWYAQKGHKYSDLSPPVCPPFCHFRSTLQECITSCVFVVGRSLVGSLPAFCSAARAILLHARVGCRTVVLQEKRTTYLVYAVRFPLFIDLMLYAWLSLLEGTSRGNTLLEHCSRSSRVGLCYGFLARNASTSTALSSRLNLSLS